MTSTLNNGATEINILSGVRGFADGMMTPAPEFLLKDLAKFGDIPGVTVHEMTTTGATQVQQMVNGPGTTIGAFCNSGPCLGAVTGAKQ